MTLKLYNTLTRKKEVFKPLKEGEVKMYVCGPTVYDYSHLGHARAYVAFDIVNRYLRYKGLKVTYVQNITDVDDKIIKRANEQKIKPLELSEKFSQEFNADMDALGIQKPDFQPKATDAIKEMIEVIKGLIKKGFAYPVDGDVYYSVSKFKNYTKLSGMNLDEMESGKRIEVSNMKDEPLDFALWKKAKKGEISWESPWGEGRPGWHIECSAMSMKYLGETIDIHGGGQDLIFPHHSNEIAQSETYTGKKFVNYWLHNGFVTVNKAKMSKSLKNFSTIRELLKRYDASTLRFFLLSTHYRSQIDFADIYLQQAKTNLNKLLNTIENIKHALGVAVGEKETTADKKVLTEITRIKKELLSALDDDFNTSIALAKLFELAKLANKYIEGKHTSKVLRKFLDEFEDLDNIFNLFNPAEPQITEEIIDSVTKLVKDMKKDKTKFKTFGDLMNLIIEIRDQARTNKDFEKSDRIRDELEKVGIVIEDTKDGVKWRLKR